jgi:hypothetical protein
MAPPERGPGLGLAEELLLIALDDKRGDDRSSWGIESGLAGAVLLDLAERGCIGEDAGKLVAVECEALDDPLLAKALEVIRAELGSDDAKGWVAKLPKRLEPLRERVAGGLVERGILEHERRRVLGLFSTDRHPEVDPEPERELRESLRSVLEGEREPSPREALLVSLLECHGLVKRLVPKERRKAAGERAKAIADGGSISSAVGDAVEQIQAATVVATTTSVAGIN